MEVRRITSCFSRAQATESALQSPAPPKCGPSRVRSGPEHAILDTATEAQQQRSVSHQSGVSDQKPEGEVKVEASE